MAEVNRRNLDPERDQNNQQRKLDFLNQLVEAGIYNPHAPQTPASPHQVMAGSIIAASLVTGLNSDPPGLVVAQETPEAASVQWRAVADRIRPEVPRLAATMDDAEPDVPAYMTFPKEHRANLHSTNPIGCLNGEIKRRTEVVGIFPNEDAIVRLVGAILLE